MVFKEINGNGGISTECFAQRNFAHLLTQYVSAYSSSTWTVFIDSLPSFSGQPVEVYTDPNASGPGLLIMTDIANGIQIYPLNQIVGIYPGENTVYDPEFTFLTPPDPLTPGCDTDILLAIKNYIEEGTDVSLRMGPSVLGRAWFIKTNLELWFCLMMMATRQY